MSLAVLTTACRKDEDTNTTTTVDIATQNNYDTKAIQQFLKDNYFDSKGNIVAFSSSDTADDLEKPLSEYQPQLLENGTVFIIRPEAQPTSSDYITDSDHISLMHKTTTYIANNENGSIKLRIPYTFFNTISGSGVPQQDPMFFYVENSILQSSGKDKNYYEIEGFKEALQKFTSFNLDADAPYNLQGVIIVPSRAAFARDPHYNYTGYSLNDRTFVFNFQIYKATKRSAK